MKDKSLKKLSMKLKWKVENNIAGEGNNKYFFSSITIINDGTGTISNSGWKLYFNYIRIIYSNGEDEKTFTDLGLKITKYSGSLYKLEPLPNWKDLNAGDSLTIRFKSSDWAILKGDAPLGAHLQLGDRKEAYAVDVEVGDFISKEQTNRYVDDHLSLETTELRYEENKLSWEQDAGSISESVIPRPAVFNTRIGKINLRKIKNVFSNSSLGKELEYLHNFYPVKLKQISTFTNNSIGISVIGNIQEEEGYTLTGDPVKNSIQLVANSKKGLFYGLITLKQLLFISGNKPIDAFYIEDKPRFGFRGLMLDVSRHFQNKETIFKMLDNMALFKLNKLHLHFCDDEGWRIEIKSLPELTSYGSKRGFDPDEDEMLNIVFGAGDGIICKDKIPDSFYNFKGLGSGFYSQKDFIEILTYAKERNIEVIPEIDMPGHCRAAIKSMEYRYRKTGDVSLRLVEPEDVSEYQSIQLYTDNIINPCLDSTYNFLEKVIVGIQKMYDLAGADLNMIHLGGDEVPSGVWEKSPACKKYMANNKIKDIKELKDHFFNRFISIVKDKTKATVSGWDDIVMDEGAVKDKFIDSGFTSLSWSNVFGWGGEANAYKLANKGYNIVLSSATSLYLDLAYNKDPDEIGYYWAGFVDTKKCFYYRPLDIYKCMLQDRMGNYIDQESFKNMEMLTSKGKDNILGMQGLLWGENSKGEEILEYQAFPKLIGVAERAWNVNMPEVDKMENEWGTFTHALGVYILPYLDSLGVNYRIPLPGAEIIDGILNMNIRYKGLVMQYSINNGKSWKRYNDEKKPKVSGTILLRALNVSETRSSRIATINT